MPIILLLVGLDTFVGACTLGWLSFPAGVEELSAERLVPHFMQNLVFVGNFSPHCEQNIFNPPRLFKHCHKSLHLFRTSDNVTIIALSG